MKKVSRIFLAAVCALTISAGAAYASAVPNEKYVDISFTQLAREYSYSRGLVTLNITEGSKSNESHVSSGIQNPNAKVTRVELNGMIRTANMKGTGNASWWVRHEGSQTMTPVSGNKTIVSTHAFVGLPAKSDWTVWIEGAPYSTVKGGGIRVYYTDN